MKTHLKSIAIPMILLVGPIFSANAWIVKNPVDLTPTAIQNSGATYGPNVVTSIPQESHSEVNHEMNSETSYQAPVNDSVDNSSLMNETADADVPEAHHRVITDPVTENDDVAVPMTTSQSSAILENPNHVSETTVMTDRMAQQQQQVEPPSTTGMAWLIAVLALAVVGGTFYAVRNRKRDSTGYR